MKLQSALDHHPFVITEGAIIERLRREMAAALEPHILHAAFLYAQDTARQLETLYRSYLDVGRALDVPIMVFSPTWRASPERLALAGYPDAVAVNIDGVRFLRAIAASYGDYSSRIIVGGLMACRGDAYTASMAMSADAAARFHRPQVDAFVAAGVDVIKAATLPALSEALGLARTLSEAGCPYSLGFVIRPEGTLLDGTPLSDAVSVIDGAVGRAPDAYMLDCTHPATALSAIGALGERWLEIAGRVTGIQANGADLPPEALDNLDHLACDTPASLAAGVNRLYREHGFTILGGCCGTDERHIAAIGRLALS